MPVARHVLRAKAAAIEEQLHALSVAEGDHTDVLPLFARPVPGCGHQMDYGFIRPARLEVVGFVFWEPARVEQAGMVADVRPAVRVGLSLVVETGPGI